MKVLKFDDELSWLEARKTKITGTRLKDVITLRGDGKKIGYYELIAERLALPSDGENPMDRGHRLEDEAIDLLEKELKISIDREKQLWIRDDNESIAVTPDGVIGEKEAVECKCLASARHIEALLTGEIPKEYDFQILQYFIVNDKLEKLYFVFYDPRMTVKSFFYYIITRESLQDKIDTYLQKQKEILDEVNKIVNELTF